MSGDTRRDEIQRHMAAVRSGLDDDVQSVVEGTRQLADYRYYVKQFPWAAVGAAFAIGFFAVPQKPRIVTPDSDQLAALARRNQLVVKQRPKGTKTQSAAVSAATFLGNMLLRASLAYVGQRIGAVAERNPPPPPTNPSR